MSCGYFWQETMAETMLGQKKFLVMFLVSKIEVFEFILPWREKGCVWATVASSSILWLRVRVGFIMV